jgi:hypothetical protein
MVTRFGTIFWAQVVDEKSFRFFSISKPEILLRTLLVPVEKRAQTKKAEPSGS